MVIPTECCAVLLGGTMLARAGSVFMSVYIRRSVSGTSSRGTVSLPSKVCGLPLFLMKQCFLFSPHTP